MVDEDSLATVLLVSRFAGDEGLPLKLSEFWGLVEQIDRPGQLLGRTQDDLIRLGLESSRVGRVVGLLDRATAMAFELERLDHSGIATLTPYDYRYPNRFLTRLKSKASAILHAAGVLELLNKLGIGVVGSRNVSVEGAEVAKALGRRAASLGVSLVSGAARGVDQLAMNAAFQAEGSVIGIPAHSLVRTPRASDVRRAVYDGRTVMCTPYAPNSPFSVGNVIGRNKLIYALSRVTIAVTADDGSGGTWSGAQEALKGRNCRVAVWRGDGEGPGNEALERSGAVPITEVSQLDGILDQAGSGIVLSQPEQASLF